MNNKVNETYYGEMNELEEEELLITPSHLISRLIGIHVKPPVKNVKRTLKLHNSDSWV